MSDKSLSSLTSVGALAEGDKVYVVRSNNSRLVTIGNVGSIDGLTPTDSNIIVGDGSNWVTESGATARTSLGLGTGDSPQFTGAVLAGSNPQLWAQNNTLNEANSGRIDFTETSTAFGVLSGFGFRLKLDGSANELIIQGGNQATVTNLISIQRDSGSLGIADTDASHYLRLVPGSNLTADRNLTFTTGDAARTVTINGDPTLDDWFDQSVKTTASPQFTGVNVGHATDTTIARVSAGLISVEGDTVALLTATQTLTAKTIDLTSNTLVGSVTEFNTALESADFGTFAAAQTDNAAVRADGTGGLLQTSALIT